MYGIEQIWEPDIEKWAEKIKEKDAVSQPPNKELDEEAIAQEAESKAEQLIEDLGYLEPEEQIEILKQEIKYLSTEERAAVVSKLDKIDAQVAVFQNLTPEQQSEVVHKLPKETKEKWAKALVSSELGEAAIPYSANGRPLVEKDVDAIITPYYGATAVVSRFDENTKNFLADSLEKEFQQDPSIGKLIFDTVVDTFKGALQGEYNEDPSTGEILIDTAIGMIPIAGEISDIRDLSAIVGRFSEDPNEMKNPWKWISADGS